MYSTCLLRYTGFVYVALLDCFAICKGGRSVLTRISTGKNTVSVYNEEIIKQSTAVI